MSQSNSPMKRLSELLADEAAEGLDPAANEELEQLMGAGTGLGRDEFMEVASLMQVGFLKRDSHSPESMPDELRDKLAQQARDFFSQGPAQGPDSGVTDIRTARKADHQPSAASEKKPWLRQEMAGWYMAAALALAFFVLRPDQGADTRAPVSVAEQRAELMQVADVIVAPWATGVAADGYEEVEGDVIWSNSRQTGYMRLSGLVANNVSEAQYQLWIVDPSRDEQPVDGGVFDIPPGQGEVIIPIDSKLAISSPAAFAITLEQPGGVVVSNGPLLVIAPVATSTARASTAVTRRL